MSSPPTAVLLTFATMTRLQGPSTVQQFGTVPAVGCRGASSGQALRLCVQAWKALETLPKAAATVALQVCTEVHQFSTCPQMFDAMVLNGDAW